MYQGLPPAPIKKTKWPLEPPYSASGKITAKGTFAFYRKVFWGGSQGSFSICFLTARNLGAQASVEEPAGGALRTLGSQKGTPAYAQSVRSFSLVSAKAAVSAVSRGGPGRKEGEPGCACLPGEAQG